MYYVNLLKIRLRDKVVEIGPGSSPFWRADVLLDKFDASDKVPPGNFGGGNLNKKNKPFFKIVNNKIPFKDNSFDVVILSHVLEHIPDSEIEQLMTEIFRISKKVYIEFPAPLYEYLFNFPAHLNILEINNDYIGCLPKRLAPSLDNSIVKYFKEVNDKFNLKVGKKPKFLFTTGKWFENIKPEIKIFNSETEFFEFISSKSYHPHSPSFFSKLINKLSSYGWQLISIFRKSVIQSHIKSNHI